MTLWVARAMIIASATAWSLVGCSRQSEGERCDQKAAGDTDCNEGLKCIGCPNLANHNQGDRCCPPTAGTETDVRCQRSETPRPDLCDLAGTGGTGGKDAGRGGSAGSGAMSGGGEAGGGT